MSESAPNGVLSEWVCGYNKCPIINGTMGGFRRVPRRTIEPNSCGETTVEEKENNKYRNPSKWIPLHSETGLILYYIIESSWRNWGLQGSLDKSIFVIKSNGDEPNYNLDKVQ